MPDTNATQNASSSDSPSLTGLAFDAYLYVNTLLMFAFMVTSVVVSFRGIAAHAGKAKRQSEFKYTSRILLMVPIYGVQAWLSLYVRAGITNKLLEVFRKIYECVALTAFLQLLVFWLGGVERCVRILSNEQITVRSDPSIKVEGTDEVVDGLYVTSAQERVWYKSQSHKDKDAQTQMNTQTLRLCRIVGSADFDEGDYSRLEIFDCKEDDLQGTVVDAYHLVKDETKTKTTEYILKRDRTDGAELGRCVVKAVHLDHPWITRLWFHPDSWSANFPGGPVKPARFVRRTMGATLLFVPITLLSALCVLLTWHSDRFFGVGLKIATVAVTAFSGIAVYSMALFGHACWDELKDLYPLSKLVSIKALLFATGVQEFFCHFYADFLSPKLGYPPLQFGSLDPERSVEALLNSLLCFEMFLLALWHQSIYVPGELQYARPSFPGYMSVAEHDRLSHFSSRASLASRASLSEPLLPQRSLRRRCTTRFPEEEDIRAHKTGVEWLDKAYSVLYFWDILTFYDHLSVDAKTESTRDLLENVQPGCCGGWLPSCERIKGSFIYYCCHQFSCNQAQCCKRFACTPDHAKKQPTTEDARAQNHRHRVLAEQEAPEVQMDISWT